MLTDVQVVAEAELERKKPTPSEIDRQQVLTPPFRRRLVALLMAIRETVTGLLSTLKSPAIEEPTYCEPRRIAAYQNCPATVQATPINLSARH